MQGKGTSPRLKEIALVGMDLLSGAATASSNVKQAKNQFVRSYIDGLFAFFFSAQRAAINIEDARWFLELANKHAKTHITQTAAASDDTSPFVNCISLNVFKLYLSRILGTIDVSKEQLFNPQVNLNDNNNYFHKDLLYCVHTDKGDDCQGADITGSLWFTWTIHSYILS